MTELIVSAVCAAPFALIVFVMFMRRKTHCWDCGLPLDEPVWHCSHGKARGE